MDFGVIALLVGVALLGPALAGAHRLGPPVVVGEILAGVVIGRSGLDLVDPTDPFLSGLGLVGFALLMFVVGTHLPVRDRRLVGVLAPGAGIVATVVAASALLGFGLAPHVGLDRPAVLAVLLATSSGAVALPVLQDLGSTDRPILVAIVWIALADVVTVLAVPLVLATGGVGRVLTGGILVVAAAALIYAAALGLRRWSGLGRWRQESRERGWALDLRLSLLALFSCAWIAQRHGTSILISGFAVGAVVALLGEPRRVADQLIGLGEGFAIPIFYVLLGAQLDLGALVTTPSAIRLAVALAIGAVAVHVLAAVVWRLPVGLGLVSSAQLGVPSAVVAIGLATDQLTRVQASAVMASVLVALVACAVGSSLLGSRRTLTDASAPRLTT